MRKREEYEKGGNVEIFFTLECRRKKEDKKKMRNEVIPIFSLRWKAEEENEEIRKENEKWDDNCFFNWNKEKWEKKKKGF